jgi:YbbR domain-containing protein
MNWGLVTEDWRIKLLALGLAVLMLGAVAFSQNPPTTKSLTISLTYTVPPNIILINPPTKTNVIYSGLADVIANVNDHNLTASVDATHALPGASVNLNVVARSSDPVHVQVQNPPPIAVQIDTMQSKELPVQVIAHGAPGWSIDPTKTLATCPGAASPNPCAVHYNGPVSWENGLRAVVTLRDAVSVSTLNLNNQPSQLSNANGSLDSTVFTAPSTTIDVTSVNVHVEAFAGSSSVSVPLVDSPPSHSPPPGYRVTAITITPLVVTISGDPAVLARIHNIVLAGVDLSKSTSDATFQVAIDYQSLGVTGNAPIATVKYSISANPNASPSP